MAETIQNVHANPQTSTTTSKPKKKAAVANRSQAHAALENTLVKALLEQLPYSQLPSEETSRPVIFAKFIDSLAKINSCREELIALGFSLGRASISYDSPPPASVRAEKEKQVAGQYLIHLDAPVNNAGAHLGALPAEEIREYLTPILTDACRKLIEQFIDGLKALVGRELIGMADWPSEIAVKYWYCRHRIGIQAAVTTKTSKVIESQQDSLSGRLWLTTKMRHRVVEHRPTTVIRECHHHDAIEANSCSIEAATVVIPENVRQLIAAIPAWMRPSIRIADGYMIRTRIDQKQAISSSVITQVKEYEEETTTYLHGFDPALLLDNLVLAGWGPKEIEQEIKDESERRIIAKCVSKSANWGAAAFFIQPLLILFHQRLLIHPAGVLLAMLAFGVSVFCYACCLCFAFRTKATQPDQLTFQLTFAAPVLFFAGLHTLLIPGSPLWPILGFPMACLGACLAAYLAAKSPFFHSL